MKKILKFGLIGVLNTIIDFAVTNFLAWLFYTNNPLLLTLMSAIGFLIATANSYLCNKRWTFDDTSNINASSGRKVDKFYAVACFSLLVQNSIFLFCLKYLPSYVALTGFALINASKFMAVIASLTLNFLGYSVVVFRSQSLANFRSSFTFPPQETRRSGQLVAGLVCISLLVRCLYLSLNHSVFGDGVAYAQTAQLLAAGDWASVDTFWLNLFCWWESLFFFIFDSPQQAAIASCLVPAVALVIPIYFTARCLFGTATACLAGLLAALHPRLVEYSVNGYSESFYLFLLAAAALNLTLLIQSTSQTRLWVGSAFFLALYILTRQEGLILWMIFSITLFILKGSQLKYWILFNLTISISLVIWIALSLSLFGTPALFQKVSYIHKQVSEQLNPEEAAQETYGSRHDSLPNPQSNSDRFANNFVYFLTRLPGVLLSPIFIFAFLLPAFVQAKRIGRTLGDQVPLIVLLLMPPLVYLPLQLEPRLLFMMLIPLIIWSAAGIYAVTQYYSKSMVVLSVFFVVICLIGMVAMTIWRGIDLGKKAILYENLAAWIGRYVPPNEVLYGDGYGYISNTGFLTSNPVKARLWSNDSGEVIADIQRQRGHWLIVYEGFLREYNPSLLHVLKDGFPKSDKVFETKDGYGQKAQIYRLPGI